MDRLAPLETVFVLAEDDTDPMTLMSVAVLGGTAPSPAEVAGLLNARMRTAPRMRQRFVDVPFAAGRPLWVDDADFDAAHHVHGSRLPDPGGRGELAQVVGNLASGRLPHRLPLWDVWVVDGLAGDKWALVSRAHRSLLDGFRGHDPLSLLLDRRRAAGTAPTAGREPWRPGRTPHPVERWAVAVVEQMIDPRQRLRQLQFVAGVPVRLVGDMANWVVDGLVRVGFGGPAEVPAPPGPVAGRRVWEAAGIDLEAVRSIHRVLDVSVNDVILAAVTAGFRHLLLARDEEVAGRVVRAVAPVSVEPTRWRRGDGPAVLPFVVNLPVGLADPEEVVAAIHGQTAGLEDTSRAVPGRILAAMASFSSPDLVAAGTRRAAASTVRRVATVVSNAPGPQRPLYLAGRPLEEIYPCPPPLGDLRLGVAVYSYLGRLFLGVTGDEKVSPDVGELVAGFCGAVEELAGLVGPARRGARSGRSGGRHRGRGGRIDPRGRHKAPG